ncbi:MAG: hypothetical protein E7651_05985 [Ruminococcaceae bacterium]|nr:hypothetical protein [Oscillospiraceae bacterium]
MEEQLTKIETELKQFIEEKGEKGEKVLGMSRLSTSSKVGGTLKLFFGLLVTCLFSFLALLGLRRYYIFQQFFPALVVVDVVIHIILFFYILNSGMIYGDYPATYFVVSTNAIYLCDGYYCCFLYSWTFDEITMLEYGKGIVRATSRYWMSDARKSLVNKSIDETYKRNRRLVRNKQPMERRILSFSDTIVRPSESMPGGNRNYVDGRVYRYNNAPTLQTKTLHFASDSEMPELCRKAASAHRKVKIEKI